MVQISCDTCKAVKPSKETVGINVPEWILGYDLQTETPRSVQRSIRFLDHWDDRRALDLGTIHLCSEQCREEYVHGSAAA